LLAIWRAALTACDLAREVSLNYNPHVKNFNIKEAIL